MIMKKKIGILIDRMNVGGVEKIALEEVKNLRELGQDAHLLVLRRRGVINNAFPELQRQVPIIYLDDRLPIIFRFSFQFPLFYFFSFFHITYPLFIPFVIKRGEFDYIVVHGTYTAFTAITIKWIKKIPFSVFIWDPISYIIQRVYTSKIPLIFSKILIWIAKIVDRFILLNTDSILTGGKAHNKIFYKLNATKKIQALPPGVYPSLDVNTNKNDYILMATAWKRGKNPEYIFNILNKIPQLKIKIVGRWIDKIYLEEFKVKVKQYRYEKNIDIIGEVSDKELNYYYRNALVFLQTNDDRGFGMPAQEAASQGTTFIIPENQGVCELYRHGIDGFFTREHDLKKIVQYLKYLSSDKKALMSMSISAWKRTVESYTWKNHAIKIVSLY